MPEIIKYSYSCNKITCYSFEILKSVILVFAIVSIIFTFFIRDANVVGNSMYDTLHDGDKVFLTNFNYTPKACDIVAINAENMIEKRIIKRVIATEGQTLDIDYATGKVYVDGVMLEEKYISSFKICSLQHRQESSSIPKPATSINFIWNLITAINTSFLDLASEILSKAL